jgi:SAM-dependent methyltransferase
MTNSPHTDPFTNADDWEDHWNSFGDPALGNPANDYRNRLIVHYLGRPDPGATVIDIGSGQGQLALLLQEAYRDARIVGIEYSAEGVHRARKAAEEAGLAARFIQRDLLLPSSAKGEDASIQGASLAVCSEVLEHVDEPEVLLRNAADYFLPNCRLVVTVPGGPKSALDRHIGHRRHYTPESIRALLESSGFVVEHTFRAGFPFFNLYRLAVITRGHRLVEDLKDASADAPASKAQTALTWFFDRSFHWNTPNSPFGWQIVAIAVAGSPASSA